MCYFPIKIKNKRFVPTKKTGTNRPLYRRTAEIYRSRMWVLFRMQKKKEKRMESKKLRTTERNTYSDILHRDGITRKIRIHQRKI